jgi:membrane-bound serine protease (ClpP class)
LALASKIFVLTIAATAIWATQGFAGAEPTGLVYLLSIEQNIDRGAADLITRVLDEASGARAQAVIIRINTNGGLLLSTEEIVDRITRSQIPVVVYVHPSGARAWSAGSYIAMAAHRIVMAEGTSIGAATPVPSEPKVVEATSSWMESLAKLRNRNYTAAKEMVTRGRAYDAREAIRLGVADLLAKDLQDALGQLGLNKPTIREYKPDLRSSLLSLLSDPVIVSLLFEVAFLLILADIYSPTIIETVLGIGLLVLALYGLYIIGLEPLVAALLILGAAAIIAELKAGHGALALAGSIFIVLAALILVQRQPFLPSLPPLGLKLTVSNYTIAALVIIASSIFGLYIRKVREVLRRKASPLDTGRLLGMKGQAKTPISPGKPGVVLVAADTWTAYSDEEIQAGDRVTVRRVEGLKLYVSKTTAEEKEA